MSGEIRTDTNDANGNRTQVTSGAVVTDDTDDAADQLTDIAGLTLDYDGNGNRVSAGSDTFTYDWNNRLTGATVGSSTVDYDYLGDDTRISETTGTSTNLVYDRASGLPRLVDDGTTSYVHAGPSLGAEIDNTTSDTVYPLQDGLGSERVRTDDTGSIAGATDFDAWGNERASSGAQGRFGWAGDSTDATTGYSYLRARDYSPGTGRFLTRDTLDASGPGTQGTNRYSYSLNNPVTLTDPSGHFTAYAWLTALLVTGSLAVASLGVTVAAGGLAAVPVAAFLLLALVFLVVLVSVDILVPCTEATRWATCTGKMDWWALATETGVVFGAVTETTTKTADAAEKWLQDDLPELPNPDDQEALMYGLVILTGDVIHRVIEDLVPDPGRVPDPAPGLEPSDTTTTPTLQPTITPTPTSGPCDDLNTGTAVPFLQEGASTWGRQHIERGHGYLVRTGQGRFRRGVAESLWQLQAILTSAVPLAKGKWAPTANGGCLVNVRLPGVGVIGPNDRAVDGLRIFTASAAPLNPLVGAFGVITMFPTR